MSQKRVGKDYLQNLVQVFQEDLKQWYKKGLWSKTIAIIAIIEFMFVYFIFPYLFIIKICKQELQLFIE